jgi:hypothetical protein
MLPFQNCLIEIFRTAHGTVSQCNRQNCFMVEFAGSSSPFTVHDFLALKQHLDAVDVNEMAHNTARSADVVILMPPRSERCFVLTLTDVLYFRELLQGAKVMLKLNTLMQECRCCPHFTGPAPVDSPASIVHAAVNSREPNNA